MLSCFNDRSVSKRMSGFLLHKLSPRDSLAIGTNFIPNKISNAIRIAVIGFHLAKFRFSVRRRRRAAPDNTIRAS